MKRFDLTKFPRVPLFISLIAVFSMVSGVAQPAERPSMPFPIKKCWEYAVSGLNESGIAADNSSVYLSEQNARIESVSPDTGARLWATELGGTVVSNIYAGEGSVYVVTRSEGSAESHTTLRALSKETGVTIFTSALNGAGRFVLLGLAKRVFAISDGSITALDGTTGSLLWTHSLSGTVSAKPVVSNERIIIGTSGKTVLAVSIGNGEIISTIKTQFVPTAIASPDANTLIVGDERGNLSSLDLGGNIQWKLRQGARISDIEIIGGDLLVTSYDNFIYEIAADNGKVGWKKRMPGRVSISPNSSKEIAITVSYGENTALIINTKNGKSLNQLVLEGENLFVQEPVITGNSAVLATVEGVFAYGITGCPAK
jgi:FOG: WD40-like repeat